MLLDVWRACEYSTRVSPKSLLVSTLKTLRYSQPFNAVTTTSLRELTRAVGYCPNILPDRLHRVGRVDTRLPNGSVMHLETDATDWIPNRLFWGGFEAYEPETLGIFFKLAQRSTVVFDVGAYIGVFAFVAALANPDATVFGFEPMHATFARFLRNLQLNPELRVQPICAAVGEEDGSAQFYFGADHGPLPTSTSLSAEFMSKVSARSSVIVPTLCLDRFVERHSIGPVGLMKLDTESTEDAVLRGAQRILERDRPHVICEVLPAAHFDRLEHQLTKLGYHFYHLGSRGPQRAESLRASTDTMEWNWLFTTLTEDELAAELKR